MFPKPRAAASQSTKRPLARRRHIPLLGCILVPAILFLGAAYFDRNQILEQETSDARNFVGILREHVLKVLDTNDILIQQVDRRIHGMTWDDIRANREPLAAMMRDMMAPRTQLSAMGLQDSAGRQWVSVMLAGARQTPAGSDVTHREYWWGQRDSDRGVLVTRAYTGSNTNRANFALVRRRTTPDGRFDGTVHVALAVDPFLMFWERALQGRPGASVTLMRTDGAVLAHWPGPTPTSAHQTWDAAFRLGSLALQPEQDVQAAILSLDGGTSLYASSRVGSYPLVLTYATTVAAIQDRWLSHLVWLAAACVLSTAALTGSMLFAIRQTRRLEDEQTRRSAVETAAMESHRLEVLGQLTAGVAHEFANVVQMVEAGAMLIQRKSQDQHACDIAQRIGVAARRGRTLSRQMLDFSRQETSLGQHDPNATMPPREVVASVSRLLAATLGSRHKLQEVIEADGVPALVRGDRNGLEGAIMNLAVNARDAMPGGGDIVIRLAPDHVMVAERDHEDGTREGLRPGLYARISVSDKGVGMPPDVLARIGEPFFTTKPRGRGTGLGLMSVRNFVRSSGGGMRVESLPSVGTTVTLWLQAVPKPEAATGDADYFQAV